MTAKLSKEVTDRVREGRWVLSAFEVEGPSVAASFSGVTEPHLEDGDEEPRPGAFVVSLGRSLGSALDHLVTADFAVSAAAAFESSLRGERKADKRHLGFLIVAFRHTVMGQYVGPDLDNLGLQPLEARDSITVSRRGELIGQRFEAPNVPELLGKPRFQNPVDVKQHVDEIRTKSAKLLALAEEIDKAHRATARARIERDKAKEEYDRVYLRACRMFEDLCRFAGRDDLAARIRSSASRPRVSEETPEEERDRVGSEVSSEESRHEEREPETAAGALSRSRDGVADVTADMEAPRFDDGSPVPSDSQAPEPHTDAAVEPDVLFHPQIKPITKTQRQVPSETRNGSAHVIGVNRDAYYLGHYDQAEFSRECM